MMSFKGNYTAVNFLWPGEGRGFKTEDIPRPDFLNQDGGWYMSTC